MIEIKVQEDKFTKLIWSITEKVCKRYLPEGCRFVLQPSMSENTWMRLKYNLRPGKVAPEFFKGAIGGLCEADGTVYIYMNNMVSKCKHYSSDWRRKNRRIVIKDNEEIMAKIKHVVRHEFRHLYQYKWEKEAGINDIDSQVFDCMWSYTNSIRETDAEKYGFSNEDLSEKSTEIQYFIDCCKIYCAIYGHLK